MSAPDSSRPPYLQKSLNGAALNCVQRANSGLARPSIDPAHDDRACITMAMATVAGCPDKPFDLVQRRVLARAQGAIGRALCDCPKNVRGTARRRLTSIDDFPRIVG
jgi:hypothetical protein